MSSRATSLRRRGYRNDQLEREEQDDHSLSPRNVATNYKRCNTWNRYDMSQKVNRPAVSGRLPTALAVFA
jgi:hypothetical protein